LAVPELLLNILGYLEHKPSLAACARVKKSWFEPASTYLWKELQSLDPLFGVLGEVRFGDARVLAGDWYEWVSTSKTPQ
jgi:hypothetical protein